MPGLKEVRSRIQSVMSTQQITKAMKMVAAAKLRRAQEAIMQMRPYAQKLDGILNNITRGVEEGATESDYTKVRPVQKVLFVLITSDRGLCGAFNSNVSKGALGYIQENYPDLAGKGQVEFMALGKKGGENMGRKGYSVNLNFVQIYSALTFNNSKKVSEYLMASYANGTYDKVYLVYNEFKNVATQIVRVNQFLPLADTQTDHSPTGSETDDDYIFEPDKATIYRELIPKSLNVKLYKSILESNASEHGARMTAMDKATDNAGELLKELRLTYNRSRQAAITKEILEIVGGAEALSDG
jgi:F-type H+-transporting ATPase subunit gamma